MTFCLSHCQELPTSKTGQSTIIFEYQAKVVCVSPLVRILEQETYVETALSLSILLLSPHCFNYFIITMITILLYITQCRLVDTGVLEELLLKF